MLRAARLSLVVVVLLTVQTTWLADLRPFGETGDLLLLLAIAAGMAGGPHRGAAVGFIAGLAMDLVLLTPLGLSSLTYLAVGYVVGTVHDGVLRSAPWIPVLVTFLASVVGVVFFVVLGQLVGQQFRVPNLPRIVLVTAVINTVLAFPALFVARWIEKAGADRMLTPSMRGLR
ncbi:MAG TPA: rod shape-determining protein MreD [Acidimicrobiales bacterium]|nr:rod shape-determining protein MreD [Acidimicrobiales bacterium]